MKYNLPKLNSILIVVFFIITIVGFALMVGAPNGSAEYNPDIFSVRRVTVGPMIALFGFIGIIFAILFNPKKKKIDDNTPTK